MSLLSRNITRLSHSRYAPALLSGTLLGLSFPSYPAIHLEVVAWIALVPLLISLRSVENAGELFRRVYLSMFVFCLISLWWVSLATLPGGVLTIFAQTFFLTVPLLAFYAVKKMAGYRFALFSLPFLWIAWEWAYMQQDLSLGWLTLGNSQANLNLMIQYADLVGVWGISFWLIWFNVFTVLALSGSRRDTLRSVTMMALMVVAPLIYASVLMYREGIAAKKELRLRVTLVQPNVNPHDKWEEYNSVEIMERYYRMTGRAVRESRPELVIWPETAIPFSILDLPYAADQQLLRLALRKWDTALLTGFIDVVHKPNQPSESFNASMLLEPDPDSVPEIYRKMRLVPFAERVPYIDYFPWLGNLTFSLAGIRGWGKGREAAVMELSSSRNGKVVLANIICYESIFPSLVTEFVRKGARLLTLVTNDGWYGTSYGPYQHLAIGRLRCIENRRAMARCANTGLTVVIDKYGRTIAEVPWWQEEILTAEVPLESRLTFYTSHPDLLPKVASILSLLIFLRAFLKSRKGESVL
ncbi:apolipoprotein N-acyltransferase [Pelodictyon phaeoclathratiforme]|uniref:Apolipoprotein N-acyltransferase n=1 Tax=Pelodictyon phaeoclathratiforme (strain DSM 5477 / BU-1) TaxID=324925 RepID=B4SG30_PELPB|nr:apolipoprotein N-acyltransferase [Pelodictyon phaeoclathratiforme]ACF43341.1 apolipoprotein N-acyltransferase [Pelodictyon phaeoclathratiforme BU-1]MBV5290625.1 apolipoprotein N-acyltransferase [Pelodictyon phaeoclathratiforme]